MPAKAAKPEPELTFEAAVERLESIVESMESDRLPLSELLVRYEEGTRLVQLCQDQLAAAEKRIEIIARGPRGEPKLEAFDPEKTPPAAAQPAQPPARASAKDSEDVSLF
jgi:exodeoxyribonuclease VII small subunit